MSRKKEPNQFEQKKRSARVHRGKCKQREREGYRTEIERKHYGPHKIEVCERVFALVTAQISIDCHEQRATAERTNRIKCSRQVIGISSPSRAPANSKGILMPHKDSLYPWKLYHKQGSKTDPLQDTENRH